MIRFQMLRPLTVCLALVGMASVALSQPKPITKDAKEEIETKITDLLTVHAYAPTVDFTQWPTFMQSEKPKMDAASTDEEFARAVNEALTKFGASHIYLATPEAVEERKSGSKVGIGVRQQPTPDGLVIRWISPGGPADKAGLVVGDMIVKVEGKKVDGTSGIAGGEGTKVALTVQHANGKQQDYTITREPFSTVRPETLTKIDDDTACLTVYTFDWNYSRDNVERLVRQAINYKNLILDLRDNGGGAVVNLQHLLSMFLPPDEPVGTFVRKPMVNAYLKDTGGKQSDVVKIAQWSQTKPEWNQDQIKALYNEEVPRFNGRVAVLINGGSGSASEICAGALKELLGAKIVGQKSAGAVLVSVIVPATNDFTLQYPVMDYVTLRGIRLEGTGITPDPDGVAEPPKVIKANQPDVAIEKAVALLEHDATLP